MLLAAVFLGRLESMAVFGGVGFENARAPYGTILNSTQMLHFKNHAFVQAWMHGGGSFDFFLEMELNDWDEDFSPHFFTGSMKYMSTWLNFAVYHRAFWLIPEFDDPLKLCRADSFNPLDPKSIQGVSLWGSPGWLTYKFTYNRLLKSDEQMWGAFLKRNFNVGEPLSYEAGVGATSWLSTVGYESLAGAAYSKLFINRFRPADFELDLEYAVSSMEDIGGSRVLGGAFLSQVVLNHPYGSVKLFYRNLSPEFWVRSSYSNFLDIDWIATAFHPLSNQRGGGVLFSLEDKLDRKLSLKMGYDYYVSKTIFSYRSDFVAFVSLKASPFSWISLKYMGWKTSSASREFVGLELFPANFYARFNVAKTVYSGAYFVNYYASLGYKLDGWEIRLDYGDNGDPTSDIYGFGVEPYSISTTTVDAFALILIVSF